MAMAPCRVCGAHECAVRMLTSVRAHVDGCAVRMLTSVCAHVDGCGVRGAQLY